MADKRILWTYHEERKLRSLWTKGLKIKIIAEKLQSTAGAIAAKARRMSLPVRPQVRAENERRQGKDKIKKRVTSLENTLAEKGQPRQWYVPQETFPLPGTTPVVLANLKKDQCRWPFGHVPDITFCGCSTDKGKSYCTEHHRLAYQGGRVLKEVHIPYQSTRVEVPEKNEEFCGLV